MARKQVEIMTRGIEGRLQVVRKQEVGKVWEMQEVGTGGLASVKNSTVFFKLPRW